MSNITGILANGCSNTWGAGLYDEQLFLNPKTQAEIDSLRIRNTWPGQLAYIIGVDKVTNLGASCGSNDRILRTTLDWCLAQTPETLKGTLAIIQWTNGMRYEFYQPRQREPDHRHRELRPRTVVNIDPERWARVKPGVLSGVANQSTEICGWDIETVSQLRYLTWTAEEMVYKDLFCYQSLARIFEQFGVRYFFWHLLGWNQPTNLRAWISQSVSWVDPTNPGLEGLDFPRTACAHPTIEGHRIIAELIHKHIANRLI